MKHKALEIECQDLESTKDEKSWRGDEEPLRRGEASKKKKKEEKVICLRKGEVWESCFSLISSS